MSSIRIEALTGDSPHVAGVQRLLDNHRKTLGFFPQGALREHIRRACVLIALDGDDCAGCLTFGPSKDYIRLIHLCVDEAHRGKGVARALVEALSQAKGHYLGIKLKCRVDYGLDGFWRNLGFVPGKTKPGRGRDRTPLNTYWRSHGHRGLFDDLPSSRLRVVLDANVVLDLLDNREEESLALVADWLAGEVEYFYTPDVFDDLRGKHSREALAKRLSDYQGLNLLLFDISRLDETLSSLRRELGSRPQSSWELDLRQVAAAIIGECPFFVTRDAQLLQASLRVQDHHGVSIVRPVDLILRLDELSDRAKYTSGRLSGTGLIQTRVGHGQVERHVDVFLIPGPEKKNSLRKRLIAYLSDPGSAEVLSVSSPGEEPRGLVVYDYRRPDRLDVPLLRATPSGHPYLVTAHLLAGTMARASEKERFLVTVSDPHPRGGALQALTDLGFRFVGHTWNRYTLPMIGSGLAVREELLTKAKQYPEHRADCDELADTIQLASRADRPSVSVRVEKALWPLKIDDASIPSFIVPIKPKWAAHLFDSDLASQMIFGADAGLMLRPQNVYYRLSRPRVIQAPARVLWYVSGSPAYGGTKALRACSYIDDLEFGEADACYDRYAHLGVFSRKDVREMAGGRPVMAFTFSHTEMLRHPVPFKTVRAVIRDFTGTATTLQSPLRISPECFTKLYRLGRYGPREGSRVGESPAPFHSAQVH